MDEAAEDIRSDLMRAQRAKLARVLAQELSYLLLNIQIH